MKFAKKVASLLLPGTCDPSLISSKKEPIIGTQHRSLAHAGEERYYVHFNTHRHFVIHFHVCRFDKSPALEILNKVRDLEIFKRKMCFIFYHFLLRNHSAW